MTNIIHIPATAEAAVKELGSLGRLINARKWERAAIVASLVGPPTGKGRPAKSSEIRTFSYSTVTLAAQGIIGLRHHETVAHYRDVWCRQRPVPALGEAVDMDGLPEWPGIPEEELAQHTGMTPERKDTLLEAGKAAGMPTGAKVVDIAANPKALQAAIKADPATERAAREALDEVATTRHERLRPPPGTPEGKAIEAHLSAQNDATTKIAIPIFDACVLIEGAQRVWEEEWPNLSEREKREVDRTLGEIVVIVEALRFNLSVEEPR